MDSLDRQAVYELIDGERQYQNKLGGDRMEFKELPHSVGAYTTMLAHYQAELIKAWTLNAGDMKALEVVRKIAGIAVHCMEDHGAPPRYVIRPPTTTLMAPREAIHFPPNMGLGTYKLGKGSLKNLEGVHPDLVWIVHYAIRTTSQDFTVTDGVRTIAEQTENVRRGVSQTMKSRHLIQPDGWGHAVDLVPWINGKARWELPACYKIMEAVRLASHARGRLIRWGGAWVPLRDSDPLVAPEKLVQAYAARKRGKGKPAFIDGPHYEMAWNA